MRSEKCGVWEAAGSVRCVTVSFSCLTDGYRDSLDYENGIGTWMKCVWSLISYISSYTSFIKVRILITDARAIREGGGVMTDGN
jgi:hypothetical protein